MHLLIPAAGSGRRMGSERNKLLLPLLGQPVLAWTLQAAKQAESIEWIGIIGQPCDWQDFKVIVAQLGLEDTVQFIQGGPPGKNRFIAASRGCPQRQSGF